MTKVFFIGAPAVYTTVNVALMLAYAKSLLGPVPDELIWFFLGVSVVGTVATIPVYLALCRNNLHWAACLSVFLLFCGLIWFNLWCFYSASAAA